MQVLFLTVFSSKREHFASSKHIPRDYKEKKLKYNLRALPLIVHSGEEYSFGNTELALCNFFFFLDCNNAKYQWRFDKTSDSLNSGDRNFSKHHGSDMDG